MMFGHGLTEVFAGADEESLLDELEHDDGRGIDWPADDEGASELIAPGALEAHVVAWADYGPADGLRLRRLCVPLGLLAAMVGLAALITAGTLEHRIRQTGHLATTARAQPPSVATGDPLTASIRFPGKAGGRPVRRARLVLHTPKRIAPVNAYATPDRGIRRIQAVVSPEITVVPRVPPVPEPRAPVEIRREIAARSTPPAASAPHASTFEATDNHGGGAFTLGG